MLERQTLTDLQTPLQPLWATGGVVGWLCQLLLLVVAARSVASAECADMLCRCMLGALCLCSSVVCCRSVCFRASVGGKDWVALLHTWSGVHVHFHGMFA